MARFVFVCLAMVGFAQGALGFDPGGMFWSQLAAQLQEDNPRIEGKWNEKQAWSAWLCDGFYEYDTKIVANLDDLDLQLTEKGYLVATVQLNDLHALAQGRYRSKATACVPTSGWLGAGSRWAILQTEVHFGESGKLSDIRLKVVATRLGKLELGRYVPAWFENFFTGLVNRSLSVVWNSFLGRWINKRVTKYAREQLEKLE